MPMDLFIPEVWSGQLMVALRKRHVFGQAPLVNRDYQGDISQVGDRVHVHTHSDIVIRDYEKQGTSGDGTDPGDHTGTTLVRQRLTGTRRSLVIDQAKYFNFEIDDVDQAQTQPKLMQSAMGDAAYQLAQVADTHIAGLHGDAGHKVGTVDAPISVTVETAYNQLVDLATALDDSDVPQDGRFAILPPWYRGLIRKDDRFIAAGDGTAERTRLNGEVGEAAGFRLFVSSNVVQGAGTGSTTSAIMGGMPGTVSHAEQIASVEAYRPEDAFSDAVKGLHLYGSAVMRPEGLATLYAEDGTP